MGLIKKVFLIIIGVIAVVTVIGFLAPSYSPSWGRSLDIFVDYSSQPSSDRLSSHTTGDELAVFPPSWNLNFKISFSNAIPSDYKIKEATYIVYLEETQLSEGQFQDIHLPAYATRERDIQVTLSMDEIAKSSPQIIANALSDKGKATFKISITFKTPYLIRSWIQIGSVRISRDLEVFVHVLDSVSVSSLSWMSGGRPVSGVHPSEEIMGLIDLSQIGHLVGDLKAEITEIASDGVETVVAIKDLEVDPATGYETVNVSWRVPGSLPIDCVGFSIRLLYGGVEVWSAPTDPPPLARVYSLSEALGENIVRVTLRGTGYCAGDAVKLEVELELEVSIALEIETGTVLVNMGSGQNMITGETTIVRVEPRLEVEFDIEAYCLDLHKTNPNSSEVFTIAQGSGGYNEDALRLMQSLRDAPSENKSIRGIQIALWVIVEDPPRSEVEGRFLITESSLEDAAWLLQNIGIDPNQKRLFSTS